MNNSIRDLLLARGGDLSCEDISALLSSDLPDEELLFGIDFVETWMSKTAVARLHEIAQAHPSEVVRERAMLVATKLQ
jgi:hypothetical protein